MKKMFDALILSSLCIFNLAGVFGADELMSMSVTEGDSVTLPTVVTELKEDDVILWKFGPKDILIAQISSKESEIYNDSDGRHRDGLKLDSQTGSLTITNITSTESGLYKLITTRTDTPLKKFNITVYARLPVPVITSDSQQNVSSPEDSLSSKCVLLCSVMNVTHASLSWYKGKDSLSSISVSKFNTSLSLPLELECVDDSYSCVVNNPIANQTQHLNITDLCQPCAEHCCGRTEAAIRLVISGLVSLAIVAVLVYDISY
ncbi:hepatic and glial cell adhesion molecule-like [Triplophysa dalaica]|uniref:hepatic and glial cell adhesion molecule-like n=1 Tax=Triplophysa dalaica TaxID=1582913 RepID=UPI0024DF3D35|nr:hepatic and glial cell adhesion molecule-like [Triplophysa dalaica]